VHQGHLICPRNRTGPIDAEGRRFFGSLRIEYDKSTLGAGRTGRGEPVAQTGLPRLPLIIR
jgi:hypothetical protein